MVEKQAGSEATEADADAAFHHSGFLARLAAELAPPVQADIAVRIQRVLDELALVTGCDRCRLLRFAQSENGLCAACGLCSDVPSPQPEAHCIPLEESFCWLGERMKRSEVVAILRLDDFPAEAQAERRYYERVGCVSCLFIPLASEHYGVGAIALESNRPIDRWPDELTHVGRLAGQTLASGLRCVEHRRCVFQQLDLERIVAEIGADMANTPDHELVGKVRSGLEELGKFACADGCTLIPFPRCSERTLEELRWVSSPVDPQRAFFPDPARSEMAP